MSTFFKIILTNGNVESNNIEIQRIATRRIFRENIFYIFEKLNNQCKVDIIFIKSFYLNGNTEFYEIITGELFFYF